LQQMSDDHTGAFGNITRDETRSLQVS
jgi:hypothetical protein